MDRIKKQSEAEINDLKTQIMALETQANETASAKKKLAADILILKVFLLISIY